MCYLLAIIVVYVWCHYVVARRRSLQPCITTVSPCVIPCYPVSPCVIPCYPVSPCVIPCYPVSPCIIPCYPVSQCVIPCYPVLPCVTLCYALLPNITLYCIVLYCIESTSALQSCGCDPHSGCLCHPPLRTSSPCGYPVD